MANDPRKLFVFLLLLGWTLPTVAEEPGSGVRRRTYAADGIPVLANPGQAVRPVAARVHDFYKQSGPPEAMAVPPYQRGSPLTNPEQPPPAQARGTRLVFNKNPYTTTLGIRLDTSYKLIREIDVATYASEHQVVTAAGPTFLPLQTPCLIVGVRTLFQHADNQHLTTDEDGMSLDLFAGTRYKNHFFKWGAFWDNQDDYDKVGIAAGVLWDVPVLGNITIDSAYAYDGGGGAVQTPGGLIEPSDRDLQVRVGTYVKPNLQLGGTFQFLTYDLHSNECGAGIFGNFYWGRWIFGGDMTGGENGARGFVNIGISWGSNPAQHPRNVDLEGIDAVGWITRAVFRDISINLRRTGP